jgi:predicted kinase
MIVIVFGLPGSGKSYFASRLAIEISAEYINSDRERKKMFAKRTYSLEEKLSVYEKMLSQMRQALKENKNEVLDATFYKHDIRKKFIDEASKSGTIIFIEVEAKESLIRARLNRKREDSEADYNAYKIVRSQWEPMHKEHLKLESTDDNIADMLKQAVKYIEMNRQ